MKKYIIYIGLLTFGLILGGQLFGGSSNKETEHNHDEVTKTHQMWTCSMHPQIMQPESGDCPICGMDLIPAETSKEDLSGNQFKLTKNAMALANIQTSVVGKNDAEDNLIKLSGKIVENEESNVVQVSYFSGRIERLNVSFTGEKVRKGQLLATIYSPELYAAQQELLTAATLKGTQPALYKAVRNKLKLWKLSENQINQIEEVGKIKENFPVYATVSGTVTEKLVEQGETVKQGQPLLKITNLNTVWANFDVYENQVDLFKKGQNITINTNAYPTKGFMGKVSFIDPILDSRTRTVKLRVVLNNSTNQFKPGMFVEGTINPIKPKKEKALSIPSTAILWTGERSVVYLKTNPNEPVFEMREVLLGNKIGENHEVLEGLNNGDEIVTNGTFTIDAAAQLHGKKSMMNKEGKKTTTGHEGHLGMEATSANTNNKKLDMNERIEVPTKFQEQLKSVFNKYILIKNALVLGKNYNVQRFSKELLFTLANVDMNLLTDVKYHNKWMELNRRIKKSANSIVETNEILVQRNHFIDLSNNLIKTVKLFGTNQKVYVQFCPMADDNKGANWLSIEKEIKNPYFGSSMLNCGSIINEIK